MRRSSYFRSGVSFWRRRKSCSLTLPQRQKNTYGSQFERFDRDRVIFARDLSDLTVFRFGDGFVPTWRNNLRRVVNQERRVDVLSLSFGQWIVAHNCAGIDDVDLAQALVTTSVVVAVEHDV